MTAGTEGTVGIRATPEDVMAAISDFESYPEWSDVESAEILERDEQGRGTAVAYTIDMMGFTAAYTLEYAYFEGSSGVSWSTREAGGALKDVEGEYVLEATGEDTTVTYRLSVELAVPVPGLLVRQGERRAVKTALEGLRRRVEGAA